MESAVFGLIGVIVGSAITAVKEWWFQRSKEQKTMHRAAAMLVPHLDAFVAACARIANDDGTDRTRPGDEAPKAEREPKPKFDPTHLKIEWQSLPATVLYRALDLPHRVELTERVVAAAFAEGAFYRIPVDGFDERQYQYAGLGLEVAALAEETRSLAKLPKRPEGKWDPFSYMLRRRREIERDRQEWEAKQCLPSAVDS
jgi:hypothetical protein